jgi:D-ornithine 4,5-aminomutase subunit alpha
LNEHNLLRKGAGHCVLKISKLKNLTIRNAGLKLQEGQYIDDLVEVFNHAETK